MDELVKTFNDEVLNSILFAGDIVLIYENNEFEEMWEDSKKERPER